MDSYSEREVSKHFTGPYAAVEFDHRIDGNRAPARAEVNANQVALRITLICQACFHIALGLFSAPFQINIYHTNDVTFSHLPGRGKLFTVTELLLICLLGAETVSRKNPCPKYP